MKNLGYSEQSLVTLKKLDAVNGAVSITLEKLPTSEVIQFEMMPSGKSGHTFNLLRPSDSGQGKAMLNPSKRTLTRKKGKPKKLRFNCTSPSHRTSRCKSTSTFKHCNKRHHRSICYAAKDA